MPGTTAEDLSYQDWQDLLEQAFLVPRPPDSAFVLFADDDVLMSLMPDTGDAAGSLARAVSRRLNWGRGEALFSTISKAGGSVPGGMPPPTLPLLALTVLAATRMHRDDTFHAHAYFVRLAQILRPDLEADSLKSVRQRLSNGFGSVAEMWRDFDRWIKRCGTYGTSTIAEHPRPPRIGFALSQALLREADRMRLTEFFSALEISRRGVPSAEAFAVSLDVWSQGRRGLSEPFLRALREPELHDLIVGQVLQLAQQWNGIVRVPGGKKRLGVRLVIDLDDFETRWTAACQPGLLYDTLTAHDGSSITISTPAGGTQYLFSGAPLAAALRGEPLRAAGKESSASFSVPPVFAARESGDARGWVAVDGIEPYEEHLVVVPADLAGPMEALLHDAADEGWRLLRQRPPRVLLPGKHIYQRVRMSNAATFQQAMSTLSSQIGLSLRPDTPARPRLVNGLKVAAHLGSNHYLAGGAPELLLPAAGDARTVEASFDGHAQVPPFAATGFPIRLRRRDSPIPAGRHEVVADSESLVFHIHDSMDVVSNASVTGEAGWDLRGDKARLTTTGPFAVCGADVAGTVAAPMLLRRVSEWLAADRYGHFRTIAVPGEPAWFQDHGLPSSQYFEFLPDPGDVWLGEIRRGQVREPQLLGWQDPSIRTLTEADLACWARWRGFTGANQLFDIYLKVAHR